MDRATLEKALINADASGNTEDARMLAYALKEFDSSGKVTEKTEKRSMWESFKLGFAETDSDVGNMSTYLESVMPLGNLSYGEDGLEWVSPDEKWGAGFTDATPDERRKWMTQKKKESLEKRYGDIAESDNKISRTIGDVAGAITSPTTLLPIGTGVKSVKGLSLLGAGWGAEYSAAEQLAETGEVKAKPTAIAATIGAVATPLIVKTAGAVAKPIISRMNIKSANKKIDDIEGIIADEIANGSNLTQVLKVVKSKTGFGKKEITELTTVAHRKLAIPSKKDAIIISEARALSKPDGWLAKSGGYLDTLIGSTSTRVKAISEPVFGSLRKFEFNTHVKKHEAIEQAEPLLKTLKQLPKGYKQQVGRMLNSGDFDGVKSVFASLGDTNGINNLNKVSKLLEDLHTKLVASGRKDLGKIVNYYPRAIKDLEGLLGTLGKKTQTVLRAELQAEANKLGLKSSDEIPDDIMANIVNKHLRGFNKSKDGTPSNLKHRSIEKLTDEQQKFYYSPEESLMGYIRSAVEDIEMRQFFGRNAVDIEGRLDIQSSIGSFIAKELKNKNIKDTDVDELTNLLSARFNEGSRKPDKLISALRDLGYMTTITNPVSAATQLSDVGISAYMHGHHVLKALSKKNNISLKELGLDDVIAAEFSTVSGTSWALNKLFTISGFRTVDRLGKNTLLRSSLSKNRALSKSVKGREKIASKYKNVYGDEYSLLIDDLQNDRMTENVKLLLWNELSDAQPISLSEMPEAYLKSPNGRILYSLKTFGLKQLDLLRRDIVQEFKKGNKKQAVKNAIAYAMIVPTFAAITSDPLKNLMLGRSYEVEDIPDQYIDNVMKTFMASRYTYDKYLKEGKVVDYAANLIAPPVGWLQSIGQDLSDISSGKKEVPEKTLKELPYIGKFWHNFFGGGLEKYEERKYDEKYR